jgi:RNA polymerase sigma-70 factor (ECF subfamily)
VDNPLIVAALQRLPEEQRRAIVLYHLCDLSVDQVAAETGVPAGTVKARLSRGRAALRRILGVPDPRYSIIGTDDIATVERRHA